MRVCERITKIIRKLQKRDETREAPTGLIEIKSQELPELLFPKLIPSKPEVALPSNLLKEFALLSEGLFD